MRDCGFMTLRGAFVKPQDSIPISVGPESGLRILVKERVKVDGDEIYRLLSGPSKDHAAGIQVNPNEVFFGGLSLWLSLRDPSLCSLTAEGQSVDQEIMPCFLVIQSIQKLCVTIGLLEDEELCVFVRPPEQDSSVEQPEGYEKFELYVRSYGSGTELAERLIEQTKSWDAAGRPSSNGLRVRVYPRDAEYALSMDGYVIDKEWTRIFMRWE
ncbi:MAG: hypothetical protein JW762_11970 [Dehalococcoidales bacterium]|nr:hypothetical protein [Dehalococcoidales bacterium]